MALQDRSYAQRPPSSNGLPTGVKWLLIVNTAIFLIAFFITRFTKIDVVHNFALNPSAVVEAFAVWQLFTYMFLHLGALHWLFNAIGLYFFGNTLERIWGTDRFLKFYVTCGLGAAVLGVLGAYLFKRESQFTLGASGAILGLIVGFGVFLAEEQVFFFFIPLKAKYLAMLVGVLAFLQAFDDPVGGIVHLAGGLTGLFVVLRHIHSTIQN